MASVEHPVVGRYWGGHSTKLDKTAVYYCESYDPQQGYWMVNVSDPGSDDRVCISERAINRTFWAVDDREDGAGNRYWYIWQWGVRVPIPS